MQHQTCGVESQPGRVLGCFSWLLDGNVVEMVLASSSPVAADDLRRGKDGEDVDVVLNSTSGAEVPADVEMGTAGAGEPILTLKYPHGDGKSFSLTQEPGIPMCPVELCRRREKKKSLIIYQPSGILLQSLVREYIDANSTLTVKGLLSTPAFTFVIVKETLPCRSDVDAFEVEYEPEWLGYKHKKSSVEFLEVPSGIYEVQDFMRRWLGKAAQEALSSCYASNEKISDDVLIRAMQLCAAIYKVKDEVGDPSISSLTNRSLERLSSYQFFSVL